MPSGALVDDDQFFQQLDALHQRNWPATVPTTPIYPHGEIPVGDYLRSWARERPEQAAVIFYGTELSYAELDRLSDRFAALLHARGTRPGDRVAVLLGNCPQFHVAFYGILKLGAVYVPVNPMFREHELEHELNDAGANTIVVLDSLLPLLASVRNRVKLDHVYVTALDELIPATPSIPLPPGLPAERPTALERESAIETAARSHGFEQAINLLSALRDCTDPAPAVQIDLDAPAALNYTGGTTGMPKGCIHTQRDMLYTSATGCTMSGMLSPDRHGSAPDDISLNFLSLFWIAGENIGLLYPIFSGATVVQLARWDPVGFMSAIEHYRIRRTFLVVDNAVEIMEHPQVDRFNLRSLRHTRVSSFVRKITPDYRRRWAALTSSVMAEGAWGMTETHTSDTFTTGMQNDDMDLKGRPVFVGIPMPGTRIRICDFDTGQTLALGEEGEIVVNTPSLLKGYWNRPDATAECIRDGWFHTGDIGAYDEEGYLHFLGRRKEMLKVRGMSVFPSEIEVLLARHPAILGSGVVGRPDAERGQMPVAFVTLRRDAQPRPSAEALQQWCRDQMAGYKVPEIRIVDTLPLTATGKVKKHELETILENGA